MRKMIGMALAVLMAGAGIPGLAIATGDAPGRRLLLPGRIDAGRTVTVTAPFGGTLAGFDVAAGDIVAAGDTLFSVETTKVYAPCDGTVGSVGADVGDSAAYLQERYGAVMFIAPQGSFTIEADTKEAYAADENRLIHVGETVYIGSRSSSERVGVGFVTAVDGEKYTVEVTGGSLAIDDNVAIYREQTFTNRSKIGAGKTKKAADVPVTAEGSLFAVHVQQGDTVRRGDVLLETVDGTLGYNQYPTDHVLAGYDAIVATVDVSPGATVTQGQLLATLYPMDGLRAVAEVTEADLPYIAVGDAARVELSGEHGQAAIEGVVTAISGLSDPDAADPTYAVTVTLEATEGLRPGMTALVYLGETDGAGE